MKLEYKILWFEDQFSEVEGDVRRLESLVREFGFIPEFDHRDKISEKEIEDLALSLEDYNPYDLIIFDYDLGGDSANGLNIAAHLRSKIYTDMVFYSGQVPQKLRQYLFDSEVDGVFIVHRNVFYDDIQPIIEDHIKKFSDLNNLRGVVMAVTSEIDQSIRDLLVEKVNTKLDVRRKNNLLKKVKKKLSDSLKSKLRKVDEIDTIEKLISSFKNYNIFDFNRIRLTYLSISDEKEGFFIDESNLSKVIKERNKLAHEKAVISDGKLTLKLESGDEQYNHKKFTEIRSLLLAAHDDVKSCHEE